MAAVRAAGYSDAQITESIAYIGLAIPRTNTERGSAVLGGVALSLFDPWIALAAAVACWWLLVGREQKAPVAAPATGVEHP